MRRRTVTQGTAGLSCAAVLGLALLVAGCGGPSGEQAGERGGSNTPVGNEAVGTAVAGGQSGADLFKQKCAGCHGEKGKGGSAPKLAGTIMSNDSIVDAILHGKGKMPPVQGVDQATAEKITEYVKSLPEG